MEPTRVTEVKPTSTWTRPTYNKGGFVGGRETKEERLVKENKIARMSARRDAIEFLKSSGGFGIEKSFSEQDVYNVAQRMFEWANRPA